MVSCFRLVLFHISFPSFALSLVERDAYSYAEIQESCSCLAMRLLFDGCFFCWFDTRFLHKLTQMAMVEWVFACDSVNIIININISNSQRSSGNSNGNATATDVSSSFWIWHYVKYICDEKWSTKLNVAIKLRVRSFKAAFPYSRTKNNHSMYYFVANRIWFILSESLLNWQRAREKKWPCPIHNANFAIHNYQFIGVARV